MAVLGTAQAKRDTWNAVLGPHKPRGTPGSLSSVLQEPRGTPDLDRCPQDCTALEGHLDPDKTVCKPSLICGFAEGWLHKGLENNSASVFEIETVPNMH